ncbi:LysR family transcriptional regulator [soil metagenome]
MVAQTEVLSFLRVVKHGTLSAAARSMGVSTAALSKRLAQLEDRLGVRLINRTTRSMSLTPEGERYFEQASRLVAQFEALEQELMAGRPAGVLRVNAPLNFGRVMVAPAIAAFCRAYREMEVELTLSDHPHNLVDGGFDIGIRMGELSDSGMRARWVATNRRHLCASPGYLLMHGTPMTPRELVAHQCIVVPRSDDTLGVWSFTRDGALESVKIGGRLRCNDGEVALHWALQGHGILMRSGWDIGRYVRAGELVTVLNDYRLPDRDVFMVFHDGLAMSPKLRSFIDFVAPRLSGLELIEAA